MTGSTEQCPYFFNPFLLPKVSLSATLTIITVLIAVLLTGLFAHPPQHSPNFPSDSSKER